MNNWKHRLGFRRPKDNIEWSIWVGAFFIILAVVWSLLFVKKPPDLKPHISPAIYVGHLLRDVGFGIVACAILIAGLQSLKTSDKKAKGYLITTFALLLFVYLIGRPAISSTLLSNFHSSTYNFSNLLINKYTDALANRHLADEDKTRFRKWIAQEKYFQDGVITSYLDVNGQTIKFQPTDEDIQRRQSHLLMPTVVFILRIEMVVWALAFVIIIAIIIKNRKRY